MSDGPEPVLVIACGALARELLDILTINRLDHVTVECLPVGLHNHPALIPEAVRSRIREARERVDRIFVGYADCGTGGMLDTVLEEEGVERLPGAHCYEFFAGSARFAALHDAEPGTFYLTDYLARHFDRVVYASLGLDKHPQLLPDYFGNYRRLVYLAQTENPDLAARAEAAAERLGLAFEYRFVGYGELETAITDMAATPAAVDA